MHNIYHDLVINCPPVKVFEAITQPIHLNNWWSLQSSGTPILDTEYNLNFTDDYDWFGKVSKVEQNTSFYITMTSSDDDWNGTTFGFELKPEKGNTLVEFSHCGWKSNNHHFRHSSFCWAQLLNGLKNYLEKGIVIPFEKRN